jgi:FkbM family methyltransferase
MPSLIKRAVRKFLTPLLWDYSSAEMQCGQIVFSQFGEDILCGFFFGRNFKGTYVEVGSFHPMLLSNTYNFYRNGWRGVCIDANPEVGPLFERFRPEDTFIHSAVGEETGHIELATFKDGAFNCLSEHLPEVPETIRHTAKLIRVPIRPLSNILAEEKISSVHLLSVDCEGNDLAVLRSNDWEKCRPNVICVEDHGNWQQSEIVQFLSSVGYSLKYRPGFSSIFIPSKIAAATADSRGLDPIVQ